MTQQFTIIRKIGLGLVVGAIFYSGAAAQVQPPPPPPPPVGADTIQQDSVRARQIADSIARADTLRAPLQAFPAPAGVDEEFVWTGDQILASGALSLAELLSRVPGATVFHAGSFIAPSAAAYGGCFTCVRIFLDGIELAATDPRSNGILDNAEIPLSILHEVRVVRGAGELRLYLTTWSVVKTIPYTRIDILTGSDETSKFGALFGKRFPKRGEILQVAGQQFATNSRLNIGTGDRGFLFLRLGLAKERFSIDATVNSQSRFREAQERNDGLAPLPPFEGSRTDAYVRMTLGNTLRGAWLQVVAASMNVKEKTPNTGPPPPEPGAPAGPTADTSRTEAQYLIAGGARVGFVNALGTVRLRSLDGNRSTEIAVHGSTSFGPHRLSAGFRRDDADSLMLGEVGVVLQPLSFVRLSGVAGQLSATEGSSRPDGLFASVDIGVRVRRLWLHGGIVMRDTSALAAPTVFDATMGARHEAAATGTYARVSGALWRDIYADINVVQWDTEGWYRPKTETGASLYVDSSWLRKFPTNSFHFHAGVSVTNRTDVSFPTGAGTATVAAGHTSISSLIEIRILSAVISWQNRNIRGLEQSEVAGLELPRRFNVYGVRWVLWN